MVARIVIAGESQCKTFAEICFVADHLAKNLPSFCYVRIEKAVLEWTAWLYKINQKNKWHHSGSPLVWKELLTSGSKPCYIGGATEFLDYCYSYYKLDVFMTPETYEHLVSNYRRYNYKIKQDLISKSKLDVEFEVDEIPLKDYFTVCISGAGHPITMHLISGLIETSSDGKSICKVYIYDHKCSRSFLESVELECSYIGTKYATKVIKCVDKIGLALTNTDLLIILDHIPFRKEQSIGDWLHENKKIMQNMAFMINASASPKMKIIIPNLGPACYNATILSESLTHISKYNIVVATSDLGMEVTPMIARISEIPMRNLFCPPVWGFVGINHLVDINNTIHRYNTFEPYTRYKKVKNSSLCIGTLIPQMRTIEYLMYFDESLWKKVADEKAKLTDIRTYLNKSIAIIDLLKLWINESSEDIVTIGIHCDGSFGLDFDGYFSQPCQFVNGRWKPFKIYMLPKTPHVTIPYLQKIAKLALTFQKNDLPEIIPRKLCICKRKQFIKKGTLIPQMRTIEYLMYFDESLWKKVADEKAKLTDIRTYLNKSIAIIDLLKLWINESSEDIVTIGIHCDGSFGLDFDGYFSQPCQFVNGRWKPFKIYMLPKTPHVTIPYLQKIAKLALTFQKNDLPEIIPRKLCICKRKQFIKKGLVFYK